MSWLDRLQEGAITSAAGSRLTFSYENFERNTEARGQVYNFQNFNGSLAIGSGNSSKIYPLRCFFSGADHDLKANDFEELVLSGGVLTLEHPVYGLVNVVPLGTIKRVNGIVSGANQTIIELELFETILDFFPLAGEDYSNQIGFSVESLTNSAAENFNKLTSQSSFKKSIKEASSYVRGIANSVAEVKRDFDDIEADINRALDFAVTQPINIAFQTLRLLQTPSRVFENITARLSASFDLINQLTGKTWDQSADLLGVGAIQMAALSSVNSNIKLRSDAVLASESILKMFENWRAWRENAGAEDSSETYKDMYKMVSLSSAFLIQTSFSLLPEKAITTDRDTTILELCIELYGDDLQLDFFITSNDLSGDEILLIPKGREIVYYI